MVRDGKCREIEGGGEDGEGKRDGFLAAEAGMEAPKL